MRQLDQILAGLPRMTTLEFFASFARFEYALIYSGYLTVRQTRAEPDWAKLTNELGGSFFAQVSAAGRTSTLINDPPKKLIVRENAARFGPPPAPVTTTNGLLAAARQVRNNLFHGNKMFASNRERDVMLMLEVLWLLDFMMERAPAIRSAFHEPQR
jgi:hypothetical protein